MRRTAMAKKRQKVAGHNLASHIMKLIAGGDVRRICILDEQKSLLEIPVRAGDPGSPASAIEAPVLAAIKAFATLTDECIVEVETAEQQGQPKP
jgi:hypothetical protein